MLQEFSSLPLVLVGFLGSLVAGLGTAIGALPIFFRARWSPVERALMLALAAGVMLGATVFSLLVPALDVLVARTGNQTHAALVTSGGMALGAIVMGLIHAGVPHEHFIKGPEHESGTGLGRSSLFVLAITLHNFPEGMSVGVAYGGDFGAGVAVTIGIGLQNLPEGLAVAAALIADNYSRGRAFWIAALTGMVEPAGGLVGALAVGLSDLLLPWGLSFAAGAMLFIISGEIIPETHRNGIEQRATFSLVIGFILMLMLDVTLG
jgi:ZIP family zinc transporter